MSRSAVPYENSIRKEIYERYVAYALEMGATPSPNDFYENVLKVEHVPISKNGFRYHWERLQIEGRIRVQNRLVVIVGIELKRPLP